MTDEPHFPAPGEKIVDPYREPEKPAPAAPSQKLVTRAEPPPSSTSKPAALTRDEMQALIAVTASQAPPWKASLRRSPLLVIAGIVGCFSFWLGLVATLAALAWIARPLLRRDRFS